MNVWANTPIISLNKCTTFAVKTRFFVTSFQKKQ